LVYEIDFAIDLEFVGLGVVSNYKFNYDPGITEKAICYHGDTNEGERVRSGK